MSGKKDVCETVSPLTMIRLDMVSSLLMINYLIVMRGMTEPDAEYAWPESTLHFNKYLHAIMKTTQ